MAKSCDKLGEEMGEQPLSSLEITIEDRIFEQQKKDKCILYEAAAEEARARRQDKQMRMIERYERTRRLWEGYNRALGPEEQAFTWYRWKKAGRDRENRENQEVDVDEEENRMDHQRPQINPLRALANLHYRKSASSRLGDSKGEKEVSRATSDGILQPLREREMMRDTKSKEHEAREVTMKDFIEGIYRKTRNGTLVPKPRVATTNMHGGMKVPKDDSNTIKAHGRTVETGS